MYANIYKLNELLKQYIPTNSNVPIWDKQYDPSNWQVVKDNYNELNKEPANIMRITFA